uniref:Uncharacterized protein n=1 Tax=Nelumbo nucifera TaxID=4432 RepID=A0A822YKJ9_NELNU|nr:TPA_asm: hypothetical protein HUJ06_011484 [Nelumbo nucifera]
MLAGILTIAIDLIEIEVNSSVLNDEFITHHLCLILDGVLFCRVPPQSHCHSNHTLDVISYDLKISNPSVVFTMEMQRLISQYCNDPREQSSNLHDSEDNLLVVCYKLF